MNEQELSVLLQSLVKLPKESEWVEFKQNFHLPNEIGELISALANGACLVGHKNPRSMNVVRDVPRVCL